MPAVILAAAATVAQRPRALVKDGNIVIRSRNGEVRAITTSGRDSDPSVSCDGRRIVFVRKTGQYPGANGGIPADKTQIWLADLSAPAPAPHIVFDAPVEFRGYRSYWFASPKLSPAGNAVYFLVPEYASSSPGLYRLDLVTGQVRFLALALEFWIVPKGLFGGDLIIHQYPMLIGGGHYDVYNMIDSSGALIGAAGFNEEKIKELVSCEIGE
jgi:dipeptidyl aminopeptidase/acylaminoacyl peptidase